MLMPTLSFPTRANLILASSTCLSLTTTLIMTKAHCGLACSSLLWAQSMTCFLRLPFLSLNPVGTLYFSLARTPKLSGWPKSSLRLAKGLLMALASQALVTGWGPRQA